MGVHGNRVTATFQEGLDSIMDPQEAERIAARVTQRQVRGLKGRVPRERASGLEQCEIPSIDVTSMQQCASRRLWIPFLTASGSDVRGH